MAFDISALLAAPGMTNIAVHNVRLVDVQPGGGLDGTYERLIVEHDGERHELNCGSKWRDDSAGHDVGRMGYVVPASPLFNTYQGACYFRAYLDQSLRRVPELDNCGELYVTPHGDNGFAQVLFGWCCDARPGGFRAPAGIIPGENGQFVPDETVPVTIRVPPEFVQQCRRVQMTPVDLLRGFVGDLAGIRNYVICPRADGYSSGGSDERDHAEAWLLRAYGQNEVDVNELTQREDEDEQRAWRRDDFAQMLDDFERAGGDPDELFSAVDALVKKQEEGSE